MTTDDKESSYKCRYITYMFDICKSLYYMMANIWAMSKSWSQNFTRNTTGEGRLVRLYLFVLEKDWLFLHIDTSVNFEEFPWYANNIEQQYHQGCNACKVRAVLLMFKLDAHCSPNISPRLTPVGGSSTSHSSVVDSGSLETWNWSRCLLSTMLTLHWTKSSSCMTMNSLIMTRFLPANTWFK